MIEAMPVCRVEADESTSDRRELWAMIRRAASKRTTPARKEDFVR